jgi:hypothetical protein
MGKDEREDAPQPSDSTPFTDIQPPPAMTANDSSRPLRANSGHLVENLPNGPIRPEGDLLVRASTVSSCAQDARQRWQAQ